MAQNGISGERLFDVGCVSWRLRSPLFLGYFLVLSERRNLRERLRASRRAMPADECRQAALSVAVRVVDCPTYTQAHHVAGYWACQGELDPLPLLERAGIAGKQAYLPVIVDDPPKTLRFAPYRSDSPLRLNRFNIPEPDVPATEWVSPNQLDLVLVPLVAFDLVGTRVGMGGGFYDRSFAFLHDPAYRSKRPYLLGLGYEFQKIPDLLVREAWDIPLDAVATEAALYEFTAGNEVAKR